MYYPVVQKLARNCSISYGFRNIHTFSFTKMATKSGENPNFTPFHRTLLYYPAGQNFARNRTISYGFRDIHTFSFFTKIQDGRKKWRKSKFFPFPQDTLVLPCRSKIHTKSHYLLRFWRYSYFFIYRKNLRWPPKVVKIEIFPLSTGHSCTILWVKILLEIALSLTFWRYSHFFIFHKNLRWPPKIEILPLCIGHSPTTLWVKNSLEIALSL